ncbi:MAG: glycosyltransferase family 2 protein [Nitrososphaerales archaeon]
MLREKSKRESELERLVTIVIPTLNEEEAIAQVLQELCSCGLRKLLVVDGYSSDRTADIAKQHGARVVYQHGKGKTGAMKTAIEEVNTPYMLVMDGDFTYDASSIGRLLQHMESYDEVIGARVANADTMNGLHNFGNKIITKIFNIFMNTNLSDVCSGMYLLKTDSAREIHLGSAGFDVEAEIAAQIASSGTITEVPVNYRRRIGKQKLSTWRDGPKILRSVLGLAKSYNPGVFYSILGSSIIIPAGLMLIWSIMDWVLTGTISSPWFFLGISMLLVSIQAMGVGLIALILRRTELRTTRMMRKILKHD